MKKRYLIACLVALCLASPTAQGKRFITEHDLLKFTWIADPQISPDGSTVAFVRVTVNQQENRYETSLFAVPASGSEAPRRLTSGIRDTSPRWAPDGKRLVFVRSVEKDGKPQPPQLYLMQMDGGEGRAITDVPSGAGGPVWSPDGRTIAFSASTGSAEPKASESVGGGKSDVQVVTRAVYRSNGNPGYVDNAHHSHIFTISPVGSDTRLTPVPKQITDGEFDERGMEWAPDGSTIYFVSTHVAEPYYDESDDELFAVPTAGGAMTKITSIDGGINSVAVSPDGRQIAFVGTLRGKPIRSYSQPDLWVTNTTPGSTPRNLTADYDYDISGGIGGDQSAPRGGGRRPIVWSKDAASLLVVSAEKGSSNLKRVTISSGRIEPVTDGLHNVEAFSATPTSATSPSSTARGRRPADTRSQVSTPSSSRTSSRANRKRSTTRASTAKTSRAGS
jgi:dipeptidyl aminopeptidase/acylaminoacyl peptidase